MPCSLGGHWIFTNSTLFHFTAAFFYLYSVSLFPKTPRLGKHYFDWRGKSALPLQNKWRKYPKDVTYGDTLSELFWHRLHFCRLILFPKCSSVILCARIFFSLLARNFFKGEVHNLYFFYSYPQMHSRVCSSPQDIVNVMDWLSVWRFLEVET